MKKHLSISIACILACSVPGTAKAQLSITATMGGVPTVSGATLANLNEAAPPILTLSGPAYLITGEVTGVAARPYFSGSTAAYFGESPAYGLDASQYVSVLSGGSATFNFSTPQKYFGLLWGSIYFGDRLTFYDSANNVIGSVSGGDVPGVTIHDVNNPDQTMYVNITSTTAFSRVVATQTVKPAFEFDDIAYAQVVPEPASCVLFGAGLCILGSRAGRRLFRSVGT